MTRETSPPRTLAAASLMFSTNELNLMKPVDYLSTRDVWRRSCSRSRRHRTGEHRRYRAEAFGIHARKETAMSNQSNSKKNWRRPTARQRPVVATELSVELQNIVDQWAARQPDKPKRSEAIRRLIEAGLASSKQTSGRGQAAKALRMAAREIDSLVDKNAPPEERIRRKRRLLKGPTELREMRKN